MGSGTRRIRVMSISCINMVFRLLKGGHRFTITRFLCNGIGDPTTIVALYHIIRPMFQVLGPRVNMPSQAVNDHVVRVRIIRPMDSRNFRPLLLYPFWNVDSRIHPLFFRIRVIPMMFSREIMLDYITATVRHSIRVISRRVTMFKAGVRRVTTKARRVNHSL